MQRPGNFTYFSGNVRLSKLINLHNLNVITSAWIPTLNVRSIHSILIVITGSCPHPTLGTTTASHFDICNLHKAAPPDTKCDLLCYNSSYAFPDGETKHVIECKGGTWDHTARCIATVSQYCTAEALHAIYLCIPVQGAFNLKSSQVLSVNVDCYSTMRHLTCRSINEPDY